MLGDVALETAGFLVIMFVVPTCLLGAWRISSVVIYEVVHRWWSR
jgi:hypothetical protein